MVEHRSGWARPRGQRPTLLPVLRERLATRSAAELAALFERAGLPFAPIRKPEELFDDEHLQATGGLADITLTDGARAGQTTQTTLLPFTLAAVPTVDLAAGSITVDPPG